MIFIICGKGALNFLNFLFFEIGIHLKKKGMILILFFQNIGQINGMAIWRLGKMMKRNGLNGLDCGK